jgi:DNA-binding response OmpR family regulator
MKEKILFVDDNESLLELANNVLSKSGYECKTAANGLEAIKAIENGFKPDLVITDVVMPVLNGLGLANQLRLMGMMVPIIFISGHLGSHKSEDLEQFSNYIIGKPFEILALTNIVAEVLEKAKSQPCVAS